MSLLKEAQNEIKFSRLKNIVKADSAITSSVLEKLIEEDIVSWKGSIFSAYQNITYFVTFFLHQYEVLGIKCLELNKYCL